MVNSFIDVQVKTRLVIGLDAASECADFALVEFRFIDENQ
jgi:hypothetical protein